MCATCCVIGAFEQGVVVSSGRIRLSGMLSRGRRGMILTTKSDEVWIVESEEVADDLQIAIARSVDRASRSLERRLSRQREFGPLPPSCPTED